MGEIVHGVVILNDTSLEYLPVARSKMSAVAFEKESIVDGSSVKMLA
jgi:hypothetical protein